LAGTTAKADSTTTVSTEYVNQDLQAILSTIKGSSNQVKTDRQLTDLYRDVSNDIPHAYNNSDGITTIPSLFSNLADDASIPNDYEDDQKPIANENKSGALYSYQRFYERLSGIDQVNVKTDYDNLQKDTDPSDIQDDLNDFYHDLQDGLTDWSQNVKISNGPVITTPTQKPNAPDTPISTPTTATPSATLPKVGTIRMPKSVKHRSIFKKTNYAYVHKNSKGYDLVYLPTSSLYKFWKLLPSGMENPDNLKEARDEAVSEVREEATSKVLPGVGTIMNYITDYAQSCADNVASAQRINLSTMGSKVMLHRGNRGIRIYIKFGGVNSGQTAIYHEKKWSKANKIKKIANGLN
jgi:hypothetical protein